MIRRAGRHDESLHERGMNTPAQRFQKDSRGGIEPQVMQTEELLRYPTRGVQLVVHAEFEGTTETQDVSQNASPQPNDHDRARWPRSAGKKSSSVHATLAALGTSRMTAPNNKFGRAPTASPYATLAAASHRQPCSLSCSASQMPLPSASIVSIYPQLIGTSRDIGLR